MEIAVMDYNRGCIDIINCDLGEEEDVEELLYDEFGYKESEVYYMCSPLNKRVIEINRIDVKERRFKIKKEVDKCFSFPNSNFDTNYAGCELDWNAVKASIYMLFMKLEGLYSDGDVRSVLDACVYLFEKFAEKYTKEFIDADLKPADGDYNLGFFISLLKRMINNVDVSKEIGLEMAEKLEVVFNKEAFQDFEGVDFKGVLIMLRGN